MGFLTRLRRGNGVLSPELRAALEAEGLVLIAEGLPGSVRYRHFKMPGRRHHGKVTPEKIAIAISKERFVVYCRSGTVELIDSEFTNPRLAALAVSIEGEDTVLLVVDYDRMGQEKVSGQILIRARAANAVEIVGELNARLGR